MTGPKEGSDTQPPSLRSRRQIQSPAEQDEPARQRGDQREPLTSQEDFTPKQEAASEGRGHQEDASEDPEPPLGGIVAVETHEADGDHADPLRHEDPSELDNGHLRDGNRREAGEDDTDDDGAREKALPHLRRTPRDHEADGAPEGGRRNQTDGGPRRPEDREQDPESVVSVIGPGETDQDTKQGIADENRRRHDAPDHPSEAARTTSECSVETFDSANLCDGGLRRQPFALVNVRLHGEVIPPGAQADIGSLQCRASPGSSAEYVPHLGLSGIDWALPAESDRDQGQEEAQGRDPEPCEDHQ